jgi:putative N6-adenine-specific DNA methylase
MTIAPFPHYSLVATTMHGLEHLLADELGLLGAEDIKVLNRAVGFKGEMDIIYKANLRCRTALHILRLIENFPVRNQKEFYDRVRGIDWSVLMNSDQTMAVHAVISHSVFTNSRYVEQVAKDAVVDQFRQRYGKRPSVDLDSPAINIHIHIAGENCDVLIDSSGDSLHRRGYRRSTGPAPINEVLAAGLVLLSGWQPSQPFFDPMCGSGTIAIEAALMGLSIPPGKFRKKFGFMQWPEYEENIWQGILAESRSGSPSGDIHIEAADISETMVRISQQNIRNAGLDHIINVSRRDFRKSDPPCLNGTLVTNPPFGERINVANLQHQYTQIGDVLKGRYDGWSAWILASDKEALKFLGLRTSKKITVFNGPLECKFVNFEIFKGTLKNKFQNT